MPKLFVIGAGFSVPAGLPLGASLFREVIRLSKAQRLYDGVLKPDIDRYLLYRERTTGTSLTEQDIDFEQFLGYLDVEHFLGLQGGDTWSQDGNRSQILVRHLIAWLLWSRQRAMTAEAMSLYDEFAARLDASDIIVTFNYDTIIEDALDRRALPYRLVPSRYSEVWKDGSAVIDTDVEELTIFKLHGSIDWFDKTSYLAERRYRAAHTWLDIPQNPPHPVFNDQKIKRRRIVGTPYPKGSRLGNIFRVTNLDRFFANSRPVSHAPLLVSPSMTKIVYLGPLADLWYGMDYGGSLAETLAIIGYSLPPYDEYVRRALYQVVRNFQHFETGSIIHKTNIKFVDRRMSAADREEYFRNYSFVEWTRADVHFEGMSSDAIRLLFEERSG